MKVLFIYPDLSIDVNWQGYYYEGLASLSAILKSKGHMVELAHICNLANSEDIIQRISGGFDLVAFSCTTPMFPFVQWCAKNIKKQFKHIPLLCGGTHVTLSPRGTLKNSDVDYICVGEGEYFILELLEYLQGSRTLDTIKGLGYRKGANEIIINELPLPIDPLDDLPFPDREIFDRQHCNATSTYVSAGRGCPFRCAYCANDLINKIYNNKYLRLRRPETMISEIELLLKKYPSIKFLYFGDDVFVLNKLWLTDFCKLYSNSVGLPFCALAYPTTVTDDTIKMLKEAGCQEIRFGIQSGNEFIRNDVMLRPVTNNKIKEAFGILKKYNMEIKTDVIFGVPLEEKRHMLDTIKMCAENRVKPRGQIFYPLPDTRLEQMAVKMGLFDKNTYGEDYNSTTILNYSKLHKARVLYFSRFCYYLVPIYSIFGYSLKSLFLNKVCLYVLDKILCNDLFIYVVISMRSGYIKLRSYLRKLRGISEYRLTKLQAKF